MVIDGEGMWGIASLCNARRTKMDRVLNASQVQLTVVRNAFLNLNCGPIFRNRSYPCRRCQNFIKNSI